MIPNEIIKEVENDEEINKWAIANRIAHKTSREDKKLFRELDRKMMLKAIAIYRSSALSEVKDIIENYMDLDLLLTNVVDLKTGKTIEVPKEVQNLLDIYWEHIKNRILAQINGLNSPQTNSARETALEIPNIKVGLDTEAADRNPSRHPNTETEEGSSTLCLDCGYNEENHGQKDEFHWTNTCKKFRPANEVKR